MSHLDLRHPELAAPGFPEQDLCQRVQRALEMKDSLNQISQVAQHSAVPLLSLHLNKWLDFSKLFARL